MARPFHLDDRIRQIRQVHSTDTLALELCDRRWPLCQGFRVQEAPHLAWLSASTCEEDLPHFLAVRDGLDADVLYVLTHYWIRLEDFAFLRELRSRLEGILHLDEQLCGRERLVGVLEREAAHRARGLCPFCDQRIERDGQAVTPGR